MRALSRFLWILSLCLPTIAAGQHRTWLDIEHLPGHWVYYGPNLRLIAAMTSHGLRFDATIICPPGSGTREAKTIWYAGDHYSTYATNCAGDFGFEDVSMHNTRSTLYESLPLLAQLHFNETTSARQYTK